MMKRLLLALALLCLPLGGLDAKGSDRAALLLTVERFEKAMAADDLKTVISMVPEKVFARMAEDFEVTSERLASLVERQMKTVLEDVKILDFSMDTSAMTLEETRAGIAYAFLPTRTVVEIQDTQVETTSHTLALRDGEAWRLVRVDDAAQLKVLREVYPGFAVIEFPRSTTKLLN